MWQNDMLCLHLTLICPFKYTTVTDFGLPTMLKLFNKWFKKKAAMDLDRAILLRGAWISQGTKMYLLDPSAKGRM